MKLESILSLLSMDKLYEISRLYGFTLNDYYSRTLPSVRLAGQLVQPEVPLYAWEHFDAKTRKLCKWLSDEGGVVTMRAAREFTGFDNPTLTPAIPTLDQYTMPSNPSSAQNHHLFFPL